MVGLSSLPQESWGKENNNYFTIRMNSVYSLLLLYDLEQGVDGMSLSFLWLTWQAYYTELLRVYQETFYKILLFPFKLVSTIA